MSLADAHSCHTLKPRRFGKRLTKIKQQKRMRGNLESCIGNLESFFKNKTAESMRGMIAFSTLTFRAETNKDIHTAPNTHTHATHVSSTRFVQPSDLGYSAGEEGCRTGFVPDNEKNLKSQCPSIFTLLCVESLPTERTFAKVACVYELVQRKRVQQYACECRHRRI